MSIFSSDDSQRGYSDGLHDSEAGRDKSHLKAGLSAKFALWGTAASDSYSQAYNKAYSDGLAKQNGIYTTTSKVMANTEALLDFEMHLAAFQHQLRELTAAYVGEMTALDWTDYNRQLFDELFKKLFAVTVKIDDELVPQAQARLQQLIEAMKRTEMKG